MATEKNGELFGASDAVLLCQKIDRVLLGIGRDNIGIVPLRVVYVSRQRQVGVYLEFLDRMNWAVSFDVQQFHSSFAYFKFNQN